MPLSVQANMPVVGVGISTGVKRLFGGAWSRIKSMFRGAKPPPAPKVAKQGGQWLLQRPGRTTATVLASVRQTYERRAVPGPTDQSSSSVQPEQHAPEPDKTHTTTSAPTHGPVVGHDHDHTPVATPQERLVALGRELDDIEEALSRVQTLDRQARTAGTPSKKAKQLALDRRFQRAEAEKKIDAALKSLGTVRASGTQLGTSEAARLTALENRLYKALITLQLPKVGAVLDDLQRAGDEPIDPSDYPDLAGDPARVLASFDPDGSGESLLATPGRFLDGMMRSLRTLHQAGALDSDLMHRLADFGYMREWADSAFVDDNWKATDSLETQLRLLATGNEGAIDWLLGSDRTQDDRALDLKLKLSAVRAEQARRSGGPERETTVQPEGLIRARHELARAKRDLGRYLTAVEGSRWKGDRRTNQIIGRGSDVRITQGLLQAMRSKFGDKVGREVNLLIAHVMLLQRKIDALERQPTVDDLRAKLKSAQSELETQRDWETTQVFEPGDPQQLRAANLISEALALKDQLSKLGGSEPIDPDELDRMDTAQLDQLKERQNEYARTATRLEKVMQQIDDLHGKGVVAQATRNVLDRDDGGNDLDYLRESVTATLAVDRTQKELAAVEADLKLGLDDKELRQMGLGDSDLREIHDTIGHLVNQGLRSSADVEQTTKAIRNGLALLERGMTQDTLGQFSKAIPESRANLLMDLVFQDVTGDHRSLNLTAESDEVCESFRRAMETLLRDPSSGEETVTAIQLRLHGDSYNLAERGIAEDSKRLMEADEANQAALQVLEQAKKDGRRIDPHDDNCYAASTTLLAALHADGRSQDASLDAATRKAWAGERDRLLRQLAGFDPRRMGVTPAGRKANPNPITLRQLRGELAGLAGIASAIATVHEHERRAGLLRTRIEARAQELDDLLALRRACLGGGDPSDPTYDPASDVHKLIQNGVRAAALHVRRQQGIALDKFNPIEHRDAIEEVLGRWGIDTELFAPEINDTLHGAFGPQAIESWVEDAKRTLTDRAFHKRLEERPNSIVRTLGRLPTDHVGFDQSTRASMISMIKSLRSGDTIEVGQDHTLNLSTGRMPAHTIGFASLTARAAAAVARKSQLAIECEAHEIQVFLKTGWGGQGTLEVSADIIAAEVALGGTGGGHKLEGVALRFPNTEQGRNDLAELMHNMMSDRPEISAKTFSKAEEVLMVTDRMVKGELELEAASTTAMWAEKFPGVGLLADTVFKGKVGGYEMDASLGVKAQLGAGIEGRFVWSESAKSSVYEKEVEKDVVMHARLGIFSEMQSGLDYAMSRVPGLSDPLGDVLSHGVRQEQEKSEGDEGDKSEAPPPYADQPFGGIPRTLLGVGYDRVLYKTTKITRVNQDTDGHYQAHGNELVRRRVVQRIPRTDGKVDVAHLVGSLALDMSDDPRKRGLETDPLSAALQDSANGEFREAVEALLQQVEKGDTLSVTYTLDPEVRRIANNLRQEAIDLRAGRPGPHLAEVGNDRAKIEALAAKLDKEAQALINAESSYLPLNVQIIKASATKVNVDLLNLKLLKLERTGYGGLQRAAVTATNPRNPEAQVHGGHGHGGHGHGTPVQPLAPEVYFGTPPSPSPTTAPPPGPDGPEMPPPQPGGQVPPTAPPDPIHEVESQPSTGALLTPVLERYETLNWEAALVLASHYRPLDGQLDHLRKELAELSESLRSIDPENKLEAAADLRAGLDKLGKAISAAEGLPRAPQPKSLEEDYAKVKGKQSEPLAATIKLAKDPKILPKILTTAAPVAPGQRFYAEDQRYLACAVHALNAFIGGPLVSVEALSEFNMVQAHVEQVAPLLHVPDQDASRGNEADVPYKFLCYMRDYKALPHDVAFHLIDRVSSDPTAQKEVPPIPGDRCIVNTQNPAHFVAFRKDTAGVWWLIDSAPRASQRKMTPEDYIRERMQDPQNGFIAVTTLRT